ncbi:UrcA family protein [Sphingobium algorifonticola]|nr:UrcA family protein [Sphingobium algorifonticola]
MPMFPPAGRSLFAFVLPAAALLCAPAAMAETDLVVSYSAVSSDITKSMPVAIDDLQLGSAQGRETLRKRINFAAKTVCGYTGMNGVRPTKDYQRCFDRATTAALSDPRVSQTAAR